MNARLLLAVLSLSLAGGLTTRAADLYQAPAKTAPDAPTVAGKWQIDTETPHGRLVLALDLKVDGKDSKKITGTLSSDQMGDMPLTGEFVDGKLTFVIKSDEGELTFVAKFKDADTLAGTLSSHMGDLACAATRVKKGSDLGVRPWGQTRGSDLVSKTVIRKCPEPDLRGFWV